MLCMKDGSIMIKMTFYREQKCEYELKNNSIYLGIVQVLQLAWLIEEHLDLGPTMYRHIFTPTSPA